MTGKGRDALTDHQLRSIDLQSYIIAVGSLDRNKRLREPQLQPVFNRIEKERKIIRVVSLRCDCEHYSCKMYAIKRLSVRRLYYYCIIELVKTKEYPQPFVWTPTSSCRQFLRIITLRREMPCLFAPLPL